MKNSYPKTSRAISLLLAFCLLWLNGCGAKGERTDSGALGTAVSTPDGLTETEPTALGSGSTSLQYKALELPDYVDELQQVQEISGNIAFLSVTEDGAYACRMTPEGQSLTYLELPAPDASHYYSSIAFSEDNLCYGYAGFASDGGRSTETQLTCAALDGTEVFSLTIDSSFGDEAGSSDSTVTDIVFASDGSVFFTTPSNLFHIDETGALLGSRDISNQALRLYTASDDSVYVLEEESQTLYTLNEETLESAEAVLDCGSISSLYAVDSSCDFYAVMTDGIFAIDLGDKTKTAILPSSEMEGVSALYPVTHGAWLVLHTNFINISTGFYLAGEADASALPEKEALTIAVSNIDNTTDYLQRVAQQFNFVNESYQIDLQIFNEDELFLAMTDDPPDMIFFDNGGFWDTANAALFAKRNMLLDLSAYLEGSGAVSNAAILPNVLNIIRQDGHVYSLPYGFLYRTIYCDADYYSGGSWTLPEMLAACKALPEDVFAEDNTQESFLREVIQWCLPEFVDTAAGTCNFETDLFYELLEVCKIKMPTEEAPASIGTDYLLNYVFCAMNYDELCNLLEEGEGGIALPGFPDADGGQFQLSHALSITAASSHPDACWSFIEMMMTANGTDIYSPVLTELFEKDMQEVTSKYDDAMAARVSDMIQSTTTASDYSTPIPGIVAEEAAAYFDGSKTAEAVAALIQNRVSIYLSEQE